MARPSRIRATPAASPEPAVGGERGLGRARGRARPGRCSCRRSRRSPAPRRGRPGPRPLRRAPARPAPTPCATSCAPKVSIASRASRRERSGPRSVGGERGAQVVGGAAVAVRGPRLGPGGAQVRSAAAAAGANAETRPTPAAAASAVAWPGQRPLAPPAGRRWAAAAPSPAARWWRAVSDGSASSASSARASSPCSLPRSPAPSPAVTVSATRSCAVAQPRSPSRTSPAAVSAASASSTARGSAPAAVARVCAGASRASSASSASTSARRPRLPGRAAPDRAALPRPAELRRLPRAAAASRAAHVPSAAATSAPRAASSRSTSATANGVPSVDSNAAPEVGSRPGRDRGIRQRPQPDLDGGARTAQAVEDVGRQLLGPVREHGGQPRQPGQRRPEQGEAAGVGPLQVVDDEQRTLAHRALQQPQAAREHERAAALGVQGDGRTPSSGSSTASAARACAGSVAARSASERLPQHRAGEPPRLGALGQERPRREHRHRAGPRQLGQQPRLARPRHAAEQHEAARGHGGPQPVQLDRPADEARARRTRAPGRRPAARWATSPRSNASCSRSTSATGRRRARRPAARADVARAASAPAGSPAAASASASTSTADSASGSSATASAAWAAAARGSPTPRRRAPRAGTPRCAPGAGDRGGAGPVGVGVLGQRLAPQRERFGAGRAAAAGSPARARCDRGQELVDVDGARAPARTPRSP